MSKMADVAFGYGVSEVAPEFAGLEGGVILQVRRAARRGGRGPSPTSGRAYEEGEFEALKRAGREWAYEYARRAFGVSREGLDALADLARACAWETCRLAD